MATWRLVPVGFWKSFWLSVIVLFYWIVGVHLKNLPGIPSREDAADKGKSVAEVCRCVDDRLDADVWLCIYIYFLFFIHFLSNSYRLIHLHRIRCWFVLSENFDWDVNECFNEDCLLQWGYSSRNVL